jgi:hypothetical protein
LRDLTDVPPSRQPGDGSVREVARPVRITAVEPDCHLPGRQARITHAEAQVAASIGSDIHVRIGDRQFPVFRLRATLPPPRRFGR